MSPCLPAGPVGPVITDIFGLNGAEIITSGENAGVGFELKFRTTFLFNRPDNV